MNQPLVSVVITTYYRNDRLRECISHIEDVKYTPIEVIVVDASSTRHAQEVADHSIVNTYICLGKDPGIAQSRQVGVESSSGEFIKFVDDDDEIITGSIKRLVSELLSADRAKIAYGGFKFKDGTEFSPRPEVEGDVLEFALSMDMGPVVPSTMLVSTEAIIEIFPLNYPDGADDDAMQIELAQKFEYTSINHPVVMMGEKEDSLSKSWDHINSHLWILNEFSGLYNKYSQNYEQSLKAMYHRKTAKKISDECLWSYQLPIEYIKTAIYTDNGRPKLIAMSIASIFGTPGLKLGENIFSMAKCLYCKLSTSIRQKR